MTVRSAKGKVLAKAEPKLRAGHGVATFDELPARHPLGDDRRLGAVLGRAPGDLDGGRLAGSGAPTGLKRLTRPAASTGATDVGPHRPPSAPWTRAGASDGAS